MPRVKLPPRPRTRPSRRWTWSCSRASAQASTVMRRVGDVDVIAVNRPVIGRARLATAAARGGAVERSSSREAEVAGAEGETGARAPPLPARSSEARRRRFGVAMVSRPVGS